MGENFELDALDELGDGRVNNNSNTSTVKVIELVQKVLGDLNLINHKGFVSATDLSKSQKIIKLFEDHLYANGYEVKRLRTSNNTYTL